MTASLDLNKYSGMWYEIARTPTPFEKDCSFATAEYNLLENGKIQVINTCYSDGYERQVIGTARPSKISNFALSVRFPETPKFIPDVANYFILYTDYEYSVVYSPPNYIWILSRNMDITDEEYKFLLNKVPRILRRRVVKIV